MADRPAELFGKIRGTLEGAECKLIHAWVTIGAYDFVSVVEAPSAEAMKKNFAEAQAQRFQQLLDRMEVAISTLAAWISTFFTGEK